jgi:hypothetical protein
LRAAFIVIRLALDPFPKKVTPESLDPCYSKINDKLTHSLNSFGPLGFDPGGLGLVDERPDLDDGRSTCYMRIFGSCPQAELHAISLRNTPRRKISTTEATTAAPYSGCE